MNGTSRLVFECVLQLSNLSCNKPDIRTLDSLESVAINKYNVLNSVEFTLLNHTKVP